MPIFDLKCPACGRPQRVFRPQGWKSTQEEIKCQGCRTRMERDGSASKQTALVKETIDNGVQVKALERLADAERLHKDRVEIEDALAKGKDPGRIIR